MKKGREVFQQLHPIQMQIETFQRSPLGQLKN